MPATRQPASGFSLIEVIVALGLLAGVLISVAGLFAAGGHRVKSGRTSSEALAAARTVIEEMNSWGFRQTYGLFDDSSCNSTASSCTFAAADDSLAVKWQSMLDDSLHEGRVEVSLEALDSGTPTLATSAAIRVHVTVHWTEGLRARRVELSTVRM